MSDVTLHRGRKGVVPSMYLCSFLILFSVCFCSRIGIPWVVRQGHGKRAQKRLYLFLIWTNYGIHSENGVCMGLVYPSYAQGRISLVNITTHRRCLRYSYMRTHLEAGQFNLGRGQTSHAISSISSASTTPYVRRYASSSHYLTLLICHT